MYEAVNLACSDIESELNLRILFAVESGSRAWGFPSSDSDYDVRFVYAMPLEWYLRLEENSDTVDRMEPGDLDLSGWELRKALRLFAGCNLSLNEWLNSPIVYRNASSAIETWSQFIPSYFNPRKSAHHYFRMAEKVGGGYLAAGEIPIKKLFYLARAIYAGRWSVDQQVMPSTEFSRMLNAGIGPAWLEAWLTEMIEKKAMLPERAPVSLSAEAIAWFSAALSNLERDIESAPVQEKVGWQPLNDYILNWVGLEASCRT